MCVMEMFKKLALKLNIKQKKVAIQGMKNPISSDFDISKNEFLDELTKHAVKMYAQKCDINQFSKLVTSNPEDNSHNAIMQELFKQGVVDPFEDEKLAQLSDNGRFLRDLGLSD